MDGEETGIRAKAGGCQGSIVARRNGDVINMERVPVPEGIRWWGGGVGLRVGG